MSKRAVEKLVDELFCAVEQSQGYAFVSDGETFVTTAEFFERVRGRLGYARKTVVAMEMFLCKHGASQ